MPLNLPAAHTKNSSHPTRLVVTRDINIGTVAMCTYACAQLTLTTTTVYVVDIATISTRRLFQAHNF